MSLQYLNLFPVQTHPDVEEYEIPSDDPRKYRPQLLVALRANMAHIRQSRPDYSTYKTVDGNFWHISDSQGQVMALAFR